MTHSEYVFTSESVSEGHPDKICDRVSDTVLDVYLGADPLSRVACETLVTTDLLVLIGEVRGPDTVTRELIEKAARAAIKEIGYEQEGFHWETVKVENHIHTQSVDIAVGVDAAGNKDEGAGDQGMMFGYACRETDVLMPAPIHYSHQILQSLAEARHSGAIPDIGPDSKSQVSLQYEDNKPVRTTAVVVSTQHADEIDQDHVREIVRPHVVNVLPEGWMCGEENFFVNPTGRFVVGGPVGDSGLTGRKIIVDTYGGAAPHGGGAFSGKDPTKVDRSAAYVARYLAKNVVAAELAERCTIQLAYAIGVSRPISVYVETHGTGRMDEVRLSDILQEMVDLSPRGIREHLGLSRPIYTRTAAYGHFGRQPEEDGGFSWERTDLMDELSSAFG